MAELDTADRRVKSLVYTGIARAYLGRRPATSEWDDVCETCWGDGCNDCARTGVSPPAVPLTDTTTDSALAKNARRAPGGEKEAL
jgi:hypothetical protein